MHFRASLIALMLLGSACALDQPEASDEPAQAQVEQAFSGCGGWQCGTNSPEIANFGFWDLASPVSEGVLGAPNVAGLQIMAFVKMTGPTTYAAYVPRVIKGKLIGFPFSTNTPPYNIPVVRGSGLIDGYFLIQTPSGPFKLIVKEVGTVRSWAQTPPTLANPTPEIIYLESYKLDWTNLQGEVLTNVCNNAGQRDDLHLMNGPLSFHTLLFEGDRIDADHKRITGVDTNWFNLGCAASTLAKMALTGHTEASRLAHTFNTTLLERQTMLKMLAADYCGDGTPFTVGGQPLSWRDDAGTMKLLGQPLVLEARWTPDGAACLDKPRIDAHWTVAGSTQFGADVYDQVKNHCPASMPPSCADPSLEVDGYHLLTATVPFQPVP